MSVLYRIKYTFHMAWNFIAREGEGERKRDR